jgi:hypothetical protein
MNQAAPPDPDRASAPEAVEVPSLAQIAARLDEMELWIRTTLPAFRAVMHPSPCTICRGEGCADGEGCKA